MNVSRSIVLLDDYEALLTPAFAFEQRQPPRLLPRGERRPGAK